MPNPTDDDDFAAEPPLVPRAPPASPRLRRALTYGALALGALILLTLAYLAVLIPNTPSVKDLRAMQTVKPSVLLSADGKTLATFRRAQQEPVPLEKISPQVVQALLATEDRRFYEHKGVDVRRTISALFHTLGGDTQGGSTITQQLARNLFPEEIGHARTINRKFKEAITAVRIERVFTKRQILERYLNTAPFLYNVVGIEMAARTYYDKPAADLDTQEAATLIGMLKGTQYYNPVLHPDRAQKRRNVVLQQMVKAGALDDAAYTQLREQPVQVTLNRQNDDLGVAPHFAAYARRWLIEWADAHDYNLYTDGLVIQTTIDSRLQEAATQAVQRQARVIQQVADAEWGTAKQVPAASAAEAYASLARRVEPFRTFFSQRADLLATFIRETPEFRKAVDGGLSEAAALQRLKADAAFMAKLRDQKTRLEAGFVAMDPGTGQVKAWVGSRDFEEDQFDHVAQALRQPGSTFKPIVYGAALESGIGPERAYLDGPVEVKLDDKTIWRPTDMHGSTGQMMTLRDGLVYSKNTITAQVSQEVGIPRVVSLAQAMGVDQSKLDPVPSLALGTSPVTLLEMVDAYCTIASQGIHRKPVFIQRITDRHGQVVEEFAAESNNALSADTAVDLIDMMRGVVNQGTGTAVKTRFGIVADIAGKTGTTQNNSDGWFILMHPGLVAGAWVGFNDQRVTIRSDYWGQGGHNAILLVGDFFRDALKARLIDAKASFPPPRRPAPVLTAETPPPDDWTRQIEDIVADNPSAAGPPPQVERTPSGTIVIGDAPGVDAMKRSSGPPKSAEEIDRAVRAIGREPASAADRGGSGPSVVVPPAPPASDERAVLPPAPEDSAASE